MATMLLRVGHHDKAYAGEKPGLQAYETTLNSRTVFPTTSLLSSLPSVLIFKNDRHPFSGPPAPSTRGTLCT